MKVKTTRFGKIEISKDEIVEFSDGLLGFEKLHRYVILNTDEDSAFRWLQCLEEPDLAFVIIEPLNFMFEYDIEISDADAQSVGLNTAEGVVLYVIVSIPDDPTKMTANLQGPIVINAKNRKAKQIISTNQGHCVKVSILDEMEKRAQKIAELEASQEPDKKGEGT